MSEEQRFHADLGEAFSADAMTVVYGEGKFVLDFKKTAPRIDQVGNDSSQTLVVEHQPVIMPAEMAKVLLRMLQENLEDYEDQFGEIDVGSLETEEGGEEPDSRGMSDNYIG